MKLLAIDTASTLCAACVYDTQGGVELGRAVRDLGKGHAEHLMAVIAEALQQASVSYGDLGRIVVCVGPGSFTGVRVGVSTARGLALALKIPAVGVTSLEAIAVEARAQFGEVPVLAALDAGRDEYNIALYDAAGALVFGPSVTTLQLAASLAVDHAPVLVGSAAGLVAAEASGAFEIGALRATADVGAYARLGALADAGGGKPKPLYLRDADAKPQAGFVLPREGA